MHLAKARHPRERGQSLLGDASAGQHQQSGSGAGRPRRQPRGPFGPAACSAVAQHSVHGGMPGERDQPRVRVCQVFERAMKRDGAPGRAGDRVEQRLVDAPVGQCAKDEPVHRMLTNGARLIDESPAHARVGHVVPLGLPNHHAHGDAHARQDGFDQRHRRRQPSGIKGADQFDTGGAALLGGQGIVEGGRDDFQRQRGVHRSRTYQASQPKWPVCPSGLVTGENPLRS